MSDLVVPITQLRSIVATFQNQAATPWGLSPDAHNALTFIREALIISNKDRITLLNQLQFHLVVYTSELNDLQSGSSGLQGSVLDKEIADHIYMIDQVNIMKSRNYSAALYEDVVISQFEFLISAQESLNGILWMRFVMASKVLDFVAAIEKADTEGGNRVAVDSFASAVLMNLENVLYYNTNPTPLYKNGVSPNDINQLQLGDCWLLGMLAGIAKQNPASITDAIQVVGPGNYLVRLFDEEGNPEYISVNSSEISNNNNGNIYHADTSSETWVAVLEIAFGKSTGVFTKDVDGIMGLNGGTLDTDKSVYTGLTNKATEVDDMTSMTPQERFAYLNSHLLHNDVIQVGTAADVVGPKPAWFVGNHAFTVVGTAYGQIQIRNPWGIGSPGASPTGVISLTPEDFAKYFPNTNAVIGIA